MNRIKRALAICTSVVILATTAVVGGVALTASAHTDSVNATCEVLNVNLTQYAGSREATYRTAYQRYSWTGGNTDTAPTEVPPSDNWQANTGNYKGGDPIGSAFKGKEANWFFWTSTQVIDQPAKVNTVKVVIDGVTVADTTFSTNWSQAFAFSDKYVAHTWSVTVVAWDDSRWNVNKSGTSVPCTRPDVLDADANVSITSATCAEPGSAVLGLIQNVTWDGVLDTTPGTHSEVFTATAGHKFADGEATKSVTYTVPPRDQSLCPTAEVCESATVLPTSTNLDPRGWNLVGGEYVDGGVEFTSSNWSEEYAWQDVNFPLSEAANLDFDVSGDGIWAIILTTSGGVIHYEPVPYTDPLWTNTAGVLPANGGGQGGPYSGSLDTLLSDPTVTRVHLYHTSGSSEPETGVLHSGSFNCLEQPFDYQNRPVSVVFDVTSGDPTCVAAGAFDTSLFPIEREGYTLSVDRPYEGAGVYTITATAKDGFVIEGEASREVTVLEAIGYQDEDREAPCFLLIAPQPEEPVFKDACGTADDSVSIPTDTDLVTYESAWSEDGKTVTVTANLVNEEDSFEEGVVTEWSYTFTDEACPTTVVTAPPGLAQSGIGDGTPIALSLGFSTIILGALIAAIVAAVRRRREEDALAAMNDRINLI